MAGRERNGAMAFLSEEEPQRGVALPVLPGIARIVAPNPGVMTCHGTNTYLIDGPDGTIVLDPGPDGHPGHVEAILAAVGRPALILLTHTHHDHMGAAAALKAATGAPICAFAPSQEPGFAPDIAVGDGDWIAGMQVLHTPGHARDHACFARGEVLFTGDHVMAWSSSVVGPPNGDMAAYCASLEGLLARDDALYVPGHGPVLPDPRPYVRDLLAHRIRREEAILQALAERPAVSEELVDRLYSQTDERLRRAAGRNVMAHLLKLEAEARVVRHPGDRWGAAARTSRP